jgi:hypothetical protein
MRLNLNSEHHAMQKLYQLPNTGNMTLYFNMAMADSEYGAVHMRLAPQNKLSYLGGRPSSEFTADKTTVSCSNRLAQVPGSSTRFFGWLSDEVEFQRFLCLR